VWIHIGTALVTQAVLVLQIAGAVELQVTCPFVVPFNQASQVQTTPALSGIWLTCLSRALSLCLRMQHGTQYLSDHQQPLQSTA